MWVIATLAGLAVLIILVLCVPVDITFHIDVRGRPKFSLRLVWLFGLISKEVRRGKKKPEEKKGMDERKPKEKRRRTKALFQILRIKGLPRQLRELLRDVISSLRIRELRVNFRVGLNNPADAGLLFAVIGPTTLFLGSSRFHQIRIEPSFGDKAVCEGYLHGAVRSQPVRLVVPLLRFALSLAAIRAMKILVLSKWKGKK